MSKHHQITLAYIALERKHEQLAQLQYALVDPNVLYLSADMKKSIKEEIKSIKQTIKKLNSLAKG